MNNSYPYFPIFAASFMVDTRRMSSEEVGAYMRLLCEAWLSEQPGTLKITKDDELADLAGVSVETWKHIKSKVLAKFETGQARLVSTMLTEHWEHCNDKTRKSKRAAKKRWEGEKNAAGKPRPEVKVEGSDHDVIVS
jgi:uncharacterized protein YdaU (DUF1376 family)